MIEKVKKILEHYFSEELGEGASDDIAGEICQLFPTETEQYFKGRADGLTIKDAEIEQARQEALDKVAEDVVEPIINFYIYDTENKRKAMDIWRQVEQELKRGVKKPFSLGCGGDS